MEWESKFGAENAVVRHFRDRGFGIFPVPATAEVNIPEKRERERERLGGGKKVEEDEKWSILAELSLK